MATQGDSQGGLRALLSVLVPLGLAFFLLPQPGVLAVAVLLCFSNAGKLDLTGFSNLIGNSGSTTRRSDPIPAESVKAISIPALISCGDDGGKAMQQNLQAFEDLQSLRDEFKFCAKVARQVKQLEDLGYRGWRRVRGDGNCFYRAFYFGVLEQLSESPKCLQQWAATFEAKLRQMSYEDTAQQGAHLRLIDLFAGLAAGHGWQDRSVQGWEKMRQEDLVFASFVDQSFASLDWSMIAALRRLTAWCFLEKADDAEFGNGLSLRELLSAQSLGSPREFCDNVILVMGKEAETVVMNAVVAAVEVNMELVILDAKHPDLSVQPYTVHDAPIECPTVHLQLRPGHYDLIYRDAHGTAPMAEEATPLQPRSSDKGPVLSTSLYHHTLSAGSDMCVSCQTRVKELEDKLQEKELECSSLRNNLQAAKPATQKDDLASENERLQLALQELTAEKYKVDEALARVRGERNQFREQLGELTAGKYKVDEDLARVRGERNQFREQLGELTAEKNNVDEDPARVREQRNQLQQEVAQREGNRAQQHEANIHQRHAQQPQPQQPPQQLHQQAHQPHILQQPAQQFQLQQPPQRFYPQAHQPPMLQQLAPQRQQLPPRPNGPPPQPLAVFMPWS